MSLLKKIGASVGVGGASTQVTPDRTQASWGELITGMVRVQAGSVEQTASEIKVSLREHWVTRDSDGDREDHYEHHSEAVLATAVTLAPEAPLEWRFEVMVPDGASQYHDWEVVARVGIPRAKDSLGSAKIEVGLPAVFTSLANALAAAGQLKQVTAMVRGSEVDFDFRPPQHLKKALDGVRLIVRREGTGAAGTLEINPQERSIGDFLKSLTKKDRIRHEVRFSAEELAHEPGAVPSAVVSRFRELLQPHLQ